jgi:DNA-binding transcriptional LysR family regulator
MSSLQSASPRSALRPTLAQLRAFVAVARAGGFSEAAAELGMSQSSLSEAVAGLERALGTRLLSRTGSGAALTTTGQRALTYAVQAIRATDDLLLSAQDEAALRGTLTVATHRSLGVHLLPAALAEVHLRFPHLEVKVISAETEGESVLSGQADVGLVMASDAPLLSYPLLQDEYVAVVPPGHPAPLRRWADLEGQTLLLPATHSCTVFVMAHLQRLQIVPTNIMQFADDDVIYSMAAHGLGVAIQPWLATMPLRADLVIRRFETSFSRSLVVVTLPTRASLPHIRAFMDAVRLAAARLTVTGAGLHAPAESAQIGAGLLPRQRSQA